MATLSTFAPAPPAAALARSTPRRAATTYKRTLAGRRCIATRAAAEGDVYVVAGATGKSGKNVATELLARGKAVQVDISLTPW